GDRSVPRLARIQSGSRAWQPLFVEHDPFRKPGSTFRDHAQKPVTARMETAPIPIRSAANEPRSQLNGKGRAACMALASAVGGEGVERSHHQREAAQGPDAQECGHQHGRSPIPWPRSAAAFTGLVVWGPPEVQRLTYASGRV